MGKLKFERPVITRINAGVPDKFGMGTAIQPIGYIDDVAVEDLLADYGSPLFVISERTIREVYQEALSAFKTRYPKVQFAWSYKTNYLNAVCKVYHQEGSWAEVVSGFEFEKALANGVPGGKIIFNGPDKTEADLRKAIEHGALIHIDHFDELYEIMRLAPELGQTAKVAVRINMDTGIYPRWDRFGFNYENGEAWAAINKIMPAPNLELVGLHTHIGTYIMTPNAYAIATEKLAALVVRIERKYKHPIKYLDLGGGFASKNTLKGAYLPGSDTCPSFDDYAEAVTETLINSDIQYEQMPALFLETGRALIDEAGYLLGTVLANKRLADGRRSLVIDIGVNNLFTSFWYNHHIVPARMNQRDTEDTTIYGPLCMNIDVIREAVMFPVLEKGDPVVIKRVGAYNMTQWLQFITYRPKVVLIDMNGQPHIIRENETLETMNALDRMPGHLNDIQL
ncbi:Orn/DAP/Arg decarboxylase 2 [Chloroherpeton thalassium ATCC 35110]|uniref:Orn/DAP/Arg decarboxylase 2 n=1 Tax=Chloroherpeton thalassium (strain ATCC 35110 / GB-78) TaxID=517418 RepID=B3QUA3_CHLT3|nr:alanine racemase [Chloroherpeton thalassium]ACF14352.1 Orn/DAP/Arg decarboxylase 2 [Chloroherpeton thalassium ATCC 35110]